MKPGELDFSKLGQARLPRVGEKWRLRIRNEECPPNPCCGYVPGERLKREGFNGEVVTVLAAANRSRYAYICECGVERRSQTVGLVVEAGKPLYIEGERFQIEVYPQWLEPLEDEQP